MPMSPHRPALATILVAFVAVLALRATPAAAAPPPAPGYDVVAETALKYEGTYGGDCWPFVQKVVLEATGRQMGFDYREGFLDAGAVEVSVAQARSGDMIQVVNDTNTSPNADYPGLHTSIVLDNLGGGLFNVIDSNSQWDGIVRVRPDYDPGAAAARYPGLTFHIYRITASGSLPNAGAPPAAAPVFQPGDRATVNTPGDCLNLRIEPSLGSPVITCMPDRTPVAISAAPVKAGGRSWVKVTTPFGDGWVAADYLAAAGTRPAGGGKTLPLLPYRNYVPQIAFN